MSISEKSTVLEAPTRGALMWSRALVMLALLLQLGCIRIATVTGEVYDCPKALLERTEAVLTRCESLEKQNEGLEK